MAGTTAPTVALVCRLPESLFGNFHERKNQKKTKQNKKKQLRVYTPETLDPKGFGVGPKRQTLLKPL